MRILPSIVALAGLGACIALPAQAQQTTANFQVSLAVEAACTVTANPLDFGSAGIIAADIAGQTTLTVACTSNTPIQVGLSGGASATPNTARHLTNGTNTVNYQLYQTDPSAGAATVWGNTQGTNTQSVTTDAAGESQLTVYGRVPAGQNVTPGSYTDNITATVWYGSSIVAAN